MTILDAIREGHRFLAQKKVDTPFLDAALLLAQASEMSKEKLFAAFPEALEPVRYARYQSLLMDRACGIPVSYLLGKKEFYSLEFLVGPGVFVPRPETETLVDEAGKLIDRMSRHRKRSSLRLHDACTGSGCVAIAVKHRYPEVQVSCSDRSPDALEACRRNAYRLLDSPIRIYSSNLLTHVWGRFDVITCNPPYLTDSAVDRMKEQGWPEPELALRGGEDGLSEARETARQARAKLAAGGVLLLEADPHQMQPLWEWMAKLGYREVRILEDMSGNPRVIAGTHG